MAITAAIHCEALTERKEDAQLRLVFAAFAQRCFREINPLVPLAMNWHVEVMTAKLAAVAFGAFADSTGIKSIDRNAP